MGKWCQLKPGRGESRNFLNLGRGIMEKILIVDDDDANAEE